MFSEERGPSLVAMRLRNQVSERKRGRSDKNAQVSARDEDDTVGRHLLRLFADDLCRYGRGIYNLRVRTTKEKVTATQRTSAKKPTVLTRKSAYQSWPRRKTA